LSEQHHNILGLFVPVLNTKEILGSGSIDTYADALLFGQLAMEAEHTSPAKESSSVLVAQFCFEFHVQLCFFLN
jgi:hypothetical protein